MGRMFETFELDDVILEIFKNNFFIAMQDFLNEALKVMCNYSKSEFFADTRDKVFQNVQNDLIEIIVLMLLFLKPCIF